MTATRLIELLSPGRRVYLSAGSAEPLAFAELCSANPERLADVQVIGSFVPGVNQVDYAALHPTARMTTLLMPATARASLKAGRLDILPISYAGFAAYLQRFPPDLAIVHVTPPDARGMCSLGPSADFAPLVWSRAKHRVAFVNPSLPSPPGGYRLPFAEIETAIDCDHPAIPLARTSPSETLTAIALHVSGLIGDGDHIQAGLGGAPAAAVSALSSHRDLVVHSGMVSDEIIDLAAAGALADEGHLAGIAIGSADFYDWLPQMPGLAFVPTPLTHGSEALAAIPRLKAINSALEVDLLGQANLEWRGSQLVSGVGGAPDFLAGARLSPGGRAIIALPSVARDKSRIVCRIDAPSVSIPRNVIDCIVTEHGVAHIRDLSVEARAQALIEIAHPHHRAELQRSWEALRDSF